MSNKKEQRFLSVQQVLTDGFYYIPAYQRNYAWGVKEISQLVADVLDYTRHNAQSSPIDYYIGTLVVYELRAEKPQHWEVVDGQQRLTTLALLVSVLRGLLPELKQELMCIPLKFECREASSQALQAVFSNPLQSESLARATKDGTAQGNTDDSRGASSIWVGRSDIEALLREKVPENKRMAFARFLLDRVKLLRVGLPPRTDLNHYFEVMNNRGEQLAKHEVLKARLLAALQQSGNQAAMRMLRSVWDACAEMDRSVQSLFLPEMRKCLFAADGKTLLVKNKDELLDLFRISDEQAIDSKYLSDLIADEALSMSGHHGKAKAVGGEDDDDESKVQFGSVINFPNFLLQVLAMMPGKGFSDTPLDDKHLLTAFEPLLRGNASQIQRFGFKLLRCRFLLDQHVIKSSVDSQGDEEHWQLQRCKFRNDKAVLQRVNAFDDAGQEDYAERLRMLQAALHVSYMLPTRKHWLQGVLRWLYRQKMPIDAQAFLLALEDLVRAFVLEVGSGADKTLSYEAVVCRQDRFFEPQSQDSALLKALPEKLVYQKARLIDFNFLDYLLWLQAKGEKRFDAQEWREFSFTSTRRSVEHLHPQTELFKGNAWEEKNLHAFGNMCLVSHAMNSRLGNSEPEYKFKQLMSERQSQSLKVFSMHSAFVAERGWAPDGAMSQHTGKVMTLLKNAFASRGLIAP